MFLSLSVSLQVQFSEPGAAPGYKGITFCWAWTASVNRKKSKVGKSLFINRAFIDLQFKRFRGIGFAFDLRITFDQPLYTAANSFANSANFLFPRTAGLCVI